MKAKKICSISVGLLVGLGSPLAGRGADGVCPPGSQPFRLPEGAALYSNDSFRDEAESAGIVGRIYCAEASESKGRTEESTDPVLVTDPTKPGELLSVARAYLASATRPGTPGKPRTEARDGYNPFENGTQDPSKDQCCEPNLPPLVGILDVKPEAPLPQISPPETVIEETVQPRAESTSGRAPASFDSNGKLPDFAGARRRPGKVFPLGDLKGTRLADMLTRQDLLEALGARPQNTVVSEESVTESEEGASPSKESPTSEQSSAPSSTTLPENTVVDALGPMIAPLRNQSLVERRQEYLESLRQSLRSTQSAAESDDTTLAEFYRKTPLPEVASRLEAAEKNLREQSRAILEEKSPLPEGEKIRLSQTYANAAEKARIARQLTLDLERKRRQALEQSKEAGTPAQTPFLLNPKEGENPLARSQELTELLGKKSAPTSADGLTQRLVLLNGLPPQEQKAALKKLKLSEPLKLALEGGSTLEVPLLHNGYITANRNPQLDCATLVTAALPADVRKGTFSTWDFRTMWTYLRTGAPPKTPKYEPKRLEKVLSTATAFEALDLYRGEEPRSGDLLVHRLPWEPTGQAFIVQEYHRETQIASVIEATQNAGSTKERELALSLDPYPKDRSQAIKIRAIRPGLMALRLRPMRQQVCTVKPESDIGRSPASLPQKEGPTAPKNEDSPPIKGGAW